MVLEIYIDVWNKNITDRDINILKIWVLKAITIFSEMDSYTI